MHTLTSCARPNSRGCSCCAAPSSVVLAALTRRLPDNSPITARPGSVCTAAIAMTAVAAASTPRVLRALPGLTAALCGALSCACSCLQASSAAHSSSAASLLGGGTPVCAPCSACSAPTEHVTFSYVTPFPNGAVRHAQHAASQPAQAMHASSEHTCSSDTNAV